VGWVRRFVDFHGRRHPRELDASHVRSFLDDLVGRGASSSTHHQALCALIFLYQSVLGLEAPWIEGLVRPTRPRRLPIVLTRQEAQSVLGSMTGVPKLMASLLYGSGLRLLECARLRVKDLDFAAGQTIVRDGKGKKDRITLLPNQLRQPLREHLGEVEQLRERDLAQGAGYVELPGALARKYPSASREWPWHWVFPATRQYIQEGSELLYRHHLHETVLQKAFRVAVRAARLIKPATCHSLRHSFATALLEAGYDIRTYRNCSAIATSRPR